MTQQSTFWQDWIRPDGIDDYEDVGIPEQVIELDTAEEGHAFVSALVCFGQTYLATHSY